MLIGFLYTVVRSELSCPGETKVSKKGMDPSVMGVSAVNCIEGQWS